MKLKNEKWKHFKIRFVFKSKNELYFQYTDWFWNLSSISKSKLHFEIKVSFWNRSPIFKWKLHFKIEVCFWNLCSISKLKLHFEIGVRFPNWSSILKSRLHLELEAPKMFILPFICKCNGTNGTPYFNHRLNKV